MLTDSWKTIFYVFLMTILAAVMAAKKEPCGELLCRDPAFGRLEAECYELWKHYTCEAEPYSWTQYLRQKVWWVDSDLPILVASIELNKDASWFYAKVPEITQNMSNHLELFLYAASVNQVKTWSAITESCIYRFSTVGFSINSKTLPTARNLTSLILQHNCLMEITGRFSDVFENLVELKLGSNKLTELEPSLFTGLIFLESLDLSKNCLRSFTWSLFDGLKALIKLDLSSNQIKKLPTYIPNRSSRLVLPDQTNSSEMCLPTQKLWLSNNEVATISRSVFKNLCNLMLLDLSSNILKSKILGTVFKDLQKLKSLRLAYSRLNSIPEDFLLDNPLVSELNLEGNLFQKIPNFTFHPHDSTVLIMQSTHFAVLDVNFQRYLKNVKMFIINKSVINRFVDEPSPQVSPLDRVQTLWCSECGLNTSEAALIIKNVASSAALSLNPISEIDSNLLTNAAQLATLYLDRDYIESANLSWKYPLIVDDQKKVKNPTTKVFISKIGCTCETLELFLIIRNFPYLPIGAVNSSVTFYFEYPCSYPEEYNKMEILDFAQNFHPDFVCKVTKWCPQNCACFFEGSKVTTVVNCTNADLLEFPSIPHDNGHLMIFHFENIRIQRLPEGNNSIWRAPVAELHLENNKLETVRELSFANKYLKAVYLRNNRLTIFEPVIESLLKGKLSLTLSGNSWVCNCQLWKYKLMMIASDRVLDFDSVSCISSTSIILLSSASRDDLCPLQLSLWLFLGLPLFVSAALIVTLTSVILHNNHKKVKYWLFVNGYCLNHLSEEEVDEDKVFDGFISYSNQDEEWVATTLLPGLENGAIPYKLCLHNRDWAVGVPIIENIFKSVNQSRRTIIVLTKYYVESSWAQLEFRASCQKSLTDKINRIIIVVPDKVPALAVVDPEIRALLKLHEYVKWSNKDQKRFWRKLYSLMPRKLPSMEFNNQDEDNCLLLASENSYA